MTAKRPDFSLASLFEHTIYNILLSAGVDVLVDRVLFPDRSFDFLFLKNEKVTALEAKGRTPSSAELKSLRDRVMARTQQIDSFLLVTPNTPTLRESVLFWKYFANLSVPCRWVDVQSLAKSLLPELPLNLKSTEALSILQGYATTAGIRASGSVFSLPFKTSKNPLQSTQQDPEQYLTRQFSYATIARLKSHDASIAKLLKLGKSVSNITVVLSDLKNFSDIVKVSDAERLAEVMARYYREARRLIWSYDGVLDKFIGDAVLAIFNYPFDDAQAPVKAIKFSMDLVSLGNNILAELLENTNAPIVTGTRVGVTTGTLWVINIGDKGPEVAFVGDAINLAARLEHNSGVDGVLFDQITKVAARIADRDILIKLKPQSKVVKKVKAKGQSHDIRCWQISSDVIREESLAIANHQPKGKET
jgi:adenylate cyclase